VEKKYGFTKDIGNYGLKDFCWGWGITGGHFRTGDIGI